jgi:plasmid stabilization system protein ParE
LKRLTSEIRDLELFPDMGSLVRDRYPVDTDYQFFYFRKNYVFYRVAGNEVRIIDVLDERADFMKILFGIDTTPPETLDYWKE